jgi:hypothetical protein
MTELTKRDLSWVLRRAPKCVVELMEGDHRAFLAGGFIRACVAGEEAQDVDMFAPDEDTAALYAALLKGDKGTAYKSPNAWTVRRPDASLPIQVIHRWAYKKPAELAESFDFTVAKSVVWCAGERDVATHQTGWRSTCHPDFYADLAARRLVYTAPKRNEDAGGSMLRVLKFYQRGYKIPLDSLAAVTARMVMAVKWDELPEPRADKETAVGMALTGLLREVDPLQDPHHIYHLPGSGDNELATEGE